MSSIIKNCNYNLADGNLSNNSQTMNIESNLNKTSQSIIVNNNNNLSIIQKSFLHNSLSSSLSSPSSSSSSSPPLLLLPPPLPSLPSLPPPESPSSSSSLLPLNNKIYNEKINKKNLKYNLNQTNLTQCINLDETNLLQNNTKITNSICTKIIKSPTRLNLYQNEKNKEKIDCQLNIENKLLNKKFLQKNENKKMNEKEMNNNKEIKKKIIYNENLEQQQQQQNTETIFTECDNNKIINSTNKTTINHLVRPTTLAFFQNFPSMVCNNQENVINENQNKYFAQNLDTNYIMPNPSSAAAAALLRCCQLNSAASSFGDIGSFCGTTTSSPYSLSAYSEPDTPITNNNLSIQQQTNLLQQNDLEQTTTNFLYPYQAYGISPSSLDIFWSAATAATPWNFAAAVNATNPIALAPNEMVNI